LAFEPNAGIFNRVSLADIEQEVKTLSRDERLSLEQYIHVLNQLEDPVVRAEIQAAMDRMDRGQKITEEEVYAEHERLLAEGL
jgi:hypothetical protein